MFLLYLQNCTVNYEISLLSGSDSAVILFIQIFRFIIEGEKMCLLNFKVTHKKNYANNSTAATM